MASDHLYTFITAIEEPPFELSETGWGEFEVLVKVHFHPAANEKAAQLYHHIRLHPYQDDPSGGTWPKDKPVTSFVYDELVSYHQEEGLVHCYLCSLSRCSMSQLRHSIRSLQITMSSIQQHCQ